MRCSKAHSDHDGTVKFVERQLFADPNAAAQDRRDRETASKPCKIHRTRQ
jgi:hypothetical protein